MIHSLIILYAFYGSDGGTLHMETNTFQPFCCNYAKSYGSMADHTPPVLFH